MMTMFYDIPMVNLSDQEMIEKARVRELVEYERYCRDYSDYGTLNAERQLWFADGRIKTSWCDFSPAEFMPEDTVPKPKIPDQGVISSCHHRVNNTVVWLKGNRAIAELLCTLMFRAKYGEEWMDNTVLCRMHYRAEKREGRWGLVFMDVVYEQDRLDPVFQDCKTLVPREALQKHRNCNWNMAYRSDCNLNGRQGRDEDLLYGYDRPEEIQNLYEESSAWLFCEN